MYRPIHIDRQNLTIMGVPFPDLKTLDSTASAIGSNMFEGFEPTANYIVLIRDYVTGKVSFMQFVEAAKNAAHA
jgi:putative transcriptional regulator